MSVSEYEKGTDFPVSPPYSFDKENNSYKNIEEIKSITGNKKLSEVVDSFYWQKYYKSILFDINTFLKKRIILIYLLISSLLV